MILRLGLVLATVLTLSSLAYFSGPPLTYRIGEIYPHDLRVRVYFEVVNETQTERARDRAVQELPSSLDSDPVAKEEIRRAVALVVDEFPSGMRLVAAGEPINERHLALLEEEHRAFQSSLKPSDHFRRALGLLLVMGMLALLTVLYTTRFQPELARTLPKIAAVCLLVVVTLGLVQMVSQAPWHGIIIPLTTTVMVLAIAYQPPFALMMSFVLALSATVSLDTDRDHFMILISGLATAVLLLRQLRTRTRLVQVAACAGLAYLAMTVAAGLLSGQTWQLIALDGLRRFLWGSLAGFLLAGSLPLVERCFGVLTDISLSELADGSHPLLQELLRRAPGTYTHSMMVATLAEAAAEAIGANPLLARVGSSFHDIGKMLKPHYFIENQTGENRHDSLEPGLSALVIFGHVKDGVALAEQYSLPRPLISFIQQHHGTTLVEYFYHEALRMRDDNDRPAVELESSFRYPGPKPRSREIGIVMLADAVESTSRALVDPAPACLRKIVHDLLMKRLLDGQFEESGLNLTELHRIEESLGKGLIALYHARIKYPDRKERETVA